MEPSIVVALITVGGSLFAAAGWLFRNLLKNKDTQIEQLRGYRDAKASECEEERERADAWQTRYVNVLIADIEERKGRDKTLELLTGAIRENNKREGP